LSDTHLLGIGGLGVSPVGRQFPNSFIKPLGGETKPRRKNPGLFYLRYMIMNQFRAMIAAAQQQWKTITIGGAGLSLQIIAIPTVAVFAWIAKQRGHPAVLSYMLLSLPLVSIWNSAVHSYGDAMLCPIGLGDVP
jgi:hypothetical protein